MRVRAHAKTHKCPEIGKRQIAAGAVGVCCQKVSEAEAMVEGGIGDVLVSNEIVGARKLERLAALAKRARIGVCVDNADNVRDLQAAAQRAGATHRRLHRAGSRHAPLRRRAGRAGAGAGARRSPPAPNLRFAGIHAYHGRAQHIRSAEERRAVIQNSSLHVKNTKTLLQKTGIACPIVTGAGSGTFMFEVELGAWDEIQPGSYVFMDWDYARNEWAPPMPRFEHSLFVLATVMSRPGAAARDRGRGPQGLQRRFGHAGRLGAAGTRLYACLRRARLGGNRARARRRPDSAINCCWCPGTAIPRSTSTTGMFACAGGVVEALWPITARGAVT